MKLRIVRSSLPWWGGVLFGIVSILTGMFNVITLGLYHCDAALSLVRWLAMRRYRA
jgi:hypothetical protein